MNERTYKSPVNIPRTGHELVTCHYPLRIDTYSSCFHNCTYCYARDILDRVHLWEPDNVRVADIETIKREIEAHILKKRCDGALAKAIQHRIPARLGGLTDCFQPIERKKKVTYQLLNYLNSINYPYLIVTKSNLIAEEVYLKAMRKDLAYIQFTITTLNENTAKLLEPNAPSPKRRIEALKHLHNKGFYIAGRISPIIPNITETDCFEVVDELEALGVPHIIFEFFRGTERMVERVESAVCVKISPLEKRGVYYRFRLKEKKAFYEKIYSRLKESKTLFTICSDGDPIPFHINSTRNCCGLEGLKRAIPQTKFNDGNEKVASNVYFEMKRKITVNIDDLKTYFSVCDNTFAKFWNAGSFTQFIDSCKWDKLNRTYRLENQ